MRHGPPRASGQRSAHPLPSRPRGLRPRAPSSYSPASRSPLARRVVSAGILVGRGRADVAASPSLGVGGMRAYVNVGRSSETAGQQDLMMRDRFLLVLLASGNSARSSPETTSRAVDAPLDALSIGA